MCAFIGMYIHMCTHQHRFRLTNARSHRAFGRQLAFHYLFQSALHVHMYYLSWSHTVMEGMPLLLWAGAAVLPFDPHDFRNRTSQNGSQTNDRKSFPVPSYVLLIPISWCTVQLLWLEVSRVNITNKFPRVLSDIE